MRRTAYLAGFLALSLAACDTANPDLASGDIAALHKGQEKVDVCHYDADAGTYHLITVAAPAVAAHLAHGDATPGDPVPTQAGYVFDEACVPTLHVLLRQLTPVVAIHEASVPVESGVGDVTGNVIPVNIDLVSPGSNSSGCEAADFAGLDFSGSNDIALIQRSVSTCTFEVKVSNAVAAGAEAVVIFNQGDIPEREGLLDSFFVGAPFVGIPVVGTSFAAGVALAQLGSTARVAVGN